MNRPTEAISWAVERYRTHGKYSHGHALLRYIEHLESRTPKTVGTLEVWKDGPYLKWGMSSADSSDGIDPTDLPDGTYHIVGPIPTPEEDHGE